MVRIVNNLKTQFPAFDKLIIVEGIDTGGADSPFPSTDPAYNKVLLLHRIGSTTRLARAIGCLCCVCMILRYEFCPSLYPVGV